MSTEATRTDDSDLVVALAGQTAVVEPQDEAGAVSHRPADHATIAAHDRARLAIREDGLDDAIGSPDVN